LENEEEPKKMAKTCIIYYYVHPGHEEENIKMPKKLDINFEGLLLKNPLFSAYAL